MQLGDVHRAVQSWVIVRRREPARAQESRLNLLTISCYYRSQYGMTFIAYLCGALRNREEKSPHPASFNTL
jgi:hypothetical protein